MRFEPSSHCDRVSTEPGSPPAAGTPKPDGRARAGRVIEMRRPGLLVASSWEPCSRCPPPPKRAVAVGLQPGADAGTVAASIERRTGSRPELLRPIPALVVELPESASLAGIRRHPLRRADPSRQLAFTPSDPLVSQPVVPTQSRFYESWLTLPALERVPVAVIDSGVDAAHPGARRKDPRLTELRRWLCRGRHARPWDLRRGSHRRRRRKRHRHRRSRAIGRAARREGRHAVADDPDRGRSESDPLGGRERGTGDQHEPRRHPRSARSRPGQLLPARSGRRRLRRLERRRRRRGRGQRRPGAVEPVAIRQLSRGLPHVLGVSAISETGGIPKFSNRDKIYNDLAAPGDRDPLDPSRVP